MIRSAHQLHTSVELTTAACLQPEPDPAEPTPLCGTKGPFGAWSPPTPAAMTIRPVPAPKAKPAKPTHHVAYQPPEERAQTALWARTARITLGVTQATMARLVVISPSMWSGYERGIYSPPERVRWAVEALLSGARALPAAAPDDKRRRRTGMDKGPELTALVDGALTRLGMNYHELATRLGCHGSEIAAWRYGRRGISPERLVRLRALLEVT